jgi:hypothetical protein
VSQRRVLKWDGDRGEWGGANVPVTNPTRLHDARFALERCRERRAPAPFQKVVPHRPVPNGAPLTTTSPCALFTEGVRALFSGSSLSLPLLFFLASLLGHHEQFVGL